MRVDAVLSSTFAASYNWHSFSPNLTNSNRLFLKSFAKESRNCDTDFRLMRMVGPNIDFLCEISVFLCASVVIKRYANIHHRGTKNTEGHRDFK